MVFNNDDKTLKLMNKELRKYKVKLKFQYYDVCPYNKNKLEIMDIVLKYVDLLESYYNKIFILSTLCDECFKSSVSYLVNIYKYFIENIYNDPLDEFYLLNLMDTIAKIKALEYTELYKDILSGPITQSAESMIKMVSKYYTDEFDDILLTLIKKENLIPKAWFGEVSEDSKYWCSYITMKCIVDKKDKKYLPFFHEILEDEFMSWINFSVSKYKNKLTLEWKRKYKLLAEKGIKKIK